jgi:hypothetical protein
MNAPDGQEEHRPFEDMAVAHVLGGLDSDQGRVFRSHLLECSDCRARVGELRAIASDLAGVERDERRERSLQAVETKRRAEDEEDAERDVVRPAGPSRWLVVGLVVGLLVTASYAFLLRGNATRLQQALDDRLEASAALEHGEDLEIAFRGAGISATARMNDGHVALLMEGMDDASPYGVYLVDDAGDGQTVYRHPLTPREGKVFVLLPLGDVEDRLIVTVPNRALATDPDGRRVLEVRMPDRGAAQDTIGSA